LLNFFLHPVGSGRTIADLYRQAFSEAAELYLVSAYLRSWDVPFRISRRCEAFAFIIGSDFGITRKNACVDVLKWLPRQRRPFFLVADSIAGFHPKAVFWKTIGGKHFALIGSSNLSEAGFSSNYEANAFGEISADKFTTVRTWIAKISRQSVPVTQTWLKTYDEAPPSRRKRATGGRSWPSTSALRLPILRNAPQVIRQRREKKRRFREIRGKLLVAMRHRAAGRMSDRAFYNVLEKTWVKHPSRIQGWGWQVQGRVSDFGALCRGFVAILAAKVEARDAVVVQVIDELHRKKIPTRRALLSELLCLFFPPDYPVLNRPVADYVRPYMKAPYGSSEGERYLHLTFSLRAALQANPDYPAKDLLELDGMIWEFQDTQEE
jgi:hypothetical protein